MADLETLATDGLSFAQQGSDPSTPASDVWRLYTKSGGFYAISDTGTVIGPLAAAPADILDLPTAEMDDTLVLAPDGVGGVEFRAESGGSGGDDFHADPAADPDADDDEGDASGNTADWTAVGSTTFDIDTTFADRLYLTAAANASTAVEGRSKAHALADGEAIVARIDGDTIRAQYNRVGVFIGASQPGRIDTMCVVYNAAGDYKGEVLAMTNASTYSSTVASATVQTGRIFPYYLAIRRNSSTSYDYLYGAPSPLGILWTTIVAARNPSMTVAVSGIFVNAQNGSSAVKGVFGWVRYFAALPVGLAP